MTGERRSQSGVSYIDVAVGTGTPVSQRRCVFADYTGWLEDGTRFDTSLEAMPGGPSAAPVSFVQGTGTVMRGWEIGFDGMRVGGKRRLFIPYTSAMASAGIRPSSRRARRSCSTSRSAPWLTRPVRASAPPGGR